MGITRNVFATTGRLLSSLKQQNVSESNVFAKYRILVEEENTEIQEALNILGLSRPPVSSIEDNYRKLLQIWSIMLDYLKYYNSLDVGPMLKVIEAFKQFFIDQNLDVFKDCISVPGIARKMLLQSGEESGRDEDLYNKMKSSLIGGLSIVITRYHEKGQFTFAKI